MTEISELKSWIAYAEEDYSAAKTLYSLKKPLLSAVCFHAQQCAEKYLKALLILRYPGNQPTSEEAKETLEIAKIVRRFARSFLGLKK